MTINQNIYNAYDQNKLQSFATPQNFVSQPQSGNPRLPDIYYMPDDFKKKKTFKEQVKTFDVMGLIYEWLDHPLLMIGTCLGLSFGIDAIDKSFCNSYEKSSLAKWAKFGDKIEQSKFVQSKPIQKCLKGISSGWKSVKGFFMKSQVIRAMVKHPTSPENPMPKSEMLNNKQRIIEEFRMLSNKFGLNGVEEEKSGKGFFSKLKRSGVKGTDLIITKDEANELKKLYNVENLSKAPQIELKRRITLSKLNVPKEEIENILKASNSGELFKDEVIKRAGLTKEEFAKIMMDSDGSSFDLVKKASENLRNIEFNEGILEIPKSTVQPLRNKNGFSKISNKALSMTDGAKTKTGRFMSVLLQKIHKGFTFGNGKAGVLLWIGPMLLTTLIDTVKADKKEKVGTLAQGTIGFMTWVFTFPLVLKFMHAYGGMKHAGMSDENVKKVKELKDQFNDIVDGKNPEKKFKSFKEYRDAKKALKKEIKTLSKVEKQSLFTKICRKVGAFTKADLGKIKSYKNGNFFADTARKIPNFLKDAIYSPARFIVFLFAFLPLADKVIEKGLSLIFGKHYDRFKVEENLSNKEEQEEYTLKDLKGRMLTLQEKKLNPPLETPESKIHDFKSNPMNINLVDGFNSLDTNKSLSAEKKNEVTDEININSSEIDEVIQDTPVVEEQTLIQQEDVNNKEIETVKVQTASQLNKTEEHQVEDINKTEEKTPIKQPNKFVSNEPEPLQKRQELESEPKIKPEPKAESKPEIKPIEQSEITQRQESKDNYSYIPSQDSMNPATQVNNKVNQKRDNYTYIPSQNSVLNQNPTVAANKYIPGQNAIKVDKSFDNSGLDSALSRADRAEQRALKVLAGDFENM